LVFLTVKFIFLFNSFLDMSRGRFGISPVVATVILVAVAIVIAIAVAFWASGLVGIFTRFEKLEITSAVFDPNTGQVELRVRNTGSSPATIDDIYVNGQPLILAGVNFVPNGAILAANNPPNAGCPDDNRRCTLNAGNDIVIQIAAPPAGVGNAWIPGVTYEIAAHTASGKMYPAAVLIP
jgi:hypothetical protein